MADTTPLLGLPYPELTDAADISEAVQPLVEKIESDLIHVGDLKATARSTAPTGWLLCDGTAVSRTTYANLYAAIGVAYGAGNGSTTFNLPDMRGRVPVGVDGAAGRMATSDALGNAAGAETHTLTIAQMPNHWHTGQGYSNVLGGGANSMGPWTSGSQGTQHVDAEGGGQSHNNMPPYQVVNWLVKF